LPRTPRSSLFPYTTLFRSEPVISAELLDLLTLVTPHIAGYSLEGKARGTQMIYDAFCQTFAFAAHKQFETQLPVCEQFFQNQDLDRKSTRLNSSHVKISYA